jgi:hypothetical protein
MDCGGSAMGASLGAATIPGATGSCVPEDEAAPASDAAEHCFPGLLQQSERAGIVVHEATNMASWQTPTHIHSGSVTAQHDDLATQGALVAAGAEREPSSIVNPV